MADQDPTTKRSILRAAIRVFSFFKHAFGDGASKEEPENGPTTPVRDSGNHNVPLQQLVPSPDEHELHVVQERSSPVRMVCLSPLES
jgi:hypothetical protein